MNVATGEVLYDTRKSHKSTDVLQFFKLIDLHVAKDLDIHVVLDNLSAHKAPPVAKWLADPKRARWHLHFTPTSSSWLNLVESWFSILTERRLRRGAFTSVDHLVVEIETWAEHWNDDPKPFVWKKPAEEIIAKVKRGRAALASAQIRDAPLAWCGDAVAARDELGSDRHHVVLRTRRAGSGNASARARPVSSVISAAVPTSKTLHPPGVRGRGRRPRRR